MKNLTLAIISTAIVLASCSSSQKSASAEYDDVYYNPNKVERQAANAVVVQEPVVTPQEARARNPYTSSRTIPNLR